MKAKQIKEKIKLRGFLALIGGGIYFLSAGLGG